MRIKSTILTKETWYRIFRRFRIDISIGGYPLLVNLDFHPFFWIIKYQNESSTDNGYWYYTKGFRIIFGPLTIKIVVPGWGFNKEWQKHDEEIVSRYVFATKENMIKYANKNDAAYSEQTDEVCSSNPLDYPQMHILDCLKDSKGNKMTLAKCNNFYVNIRS